MTPLELLTALQTVPGFYHYPKGTALMLHKITDYVRHEPVRVATIVAAVVIVTASILTGMPVAAIVGQIVAVAALFEKVRSSVAPMVDVLVHSSDVADGQTVAIVPATPDATPADLASVVETQGGDL